MFRRVLSRSVLLRVVDCWPDGLGGVAVRGHVLIGGCLGARAALTVTPQEPDTGRCGLNVLTAIC